MGLGITLSAESVAGKRCQEHVKTTITTTTIVVVVVVVAVVVVVGGP